MAIPDDLNQTMRGFMESRALLTALELDIFTAVGGGSTAQDVARRTATHPRATEMLLNALAAMGLLSKQNAMFHNTPATARYFAADSNDNARPGLLHIANLWHRWSTLTECVRRGASVRGSEVSKSVETWTENFIEAMDYNARDRAPLVVKAVGTEGVGRLLDVGGGSGAYSIAFARASERVRVTLLDLPEVLPIAGRHIHEAGLTARIEARAGDLRRDHLGTGFDLVLVLAICHMLSEEENQDLVRRCFEALAPAGRLVIQDFVLEADKTAPRQGALFALNMLVGTEAGSTYSAGEFSAWLRAAGFQTIRQVHLPGPSSLIIASKASDG